MCAGGLQCELEQRAPGTVRRRKSGLRVSQGISRRWLRRSADLSARVTASRTASGAGRCVTADDPGHAAVIPARNRARGEGRAGSTDCERPATESISTGFPARNRQGRPRPASSWHARDRLSRPPPSGSRGRGSLDRSASRCGRPAARSRPGLRVAGDIAGLLEQRARPIGEASEPSGPGASRSSRARRSPSAVSRPARSNAAVVVAFALRSAAGAACSSARTLFRPCRLPRREVPGAAVDVPVRQGGGQRPVRLATLTGGSAA